uniref:Ubiquitin-like domain-containing protein n=1 Tax=Meloidogyne javanica TaxID=6303 RepID=A0A915LJH6_MELJA
MNVIIRDFVGNKRSYEVKETDNVEILKAMIEFKTGVTTCSQKLTYGGKILQDGHKIGDYNIRNLTVIEMVPKITDIFVEFNKAN